MAKQIIGAVGVGNATFTAGQEAEFEAAAKAANVDFARLEQKGVIRGFAGKAAAASADTADTDAPAETPAPKATAAKKKAARRSR